jgi:hypothetical protein
MSIMVENDLQNQLGQKNQVWRIFVWSPELEAEQPRNLTGSRWEAFSCRPLSPMHIQKMRINEETKVIGHIIDKGIDIYVSFC